MPANLLTKKDMKELAANTRGRQTPDPDDRKKLASTLSKNALRACVAGLACCLTSVSMAQDWPSDIVRWVVPFPPGGAMDAMTRTLAAELAKDLDATFVVENQPGAGGNIGINAVANSEPDGHTIITVANGMAVNPFLYPDNAFDPVEQFEPVSLIAVVPNVLVTGSQTNSAATVDEVVAQLKAEPGQYTVASAGVGTSIHLASELFQSLTGTEMLHVPYRGSGPAIPDVMSGAIDYMFDSVTSAKPQIDAGTLRALAVTTEKRSSALPDTPTIAEAGIEGYVLTPWFAVFTPAGVDEDIVQRLNGAIGTALEKPEVQARFEAIGAEVVGSSPEELASYLAEEMATWEPLIAERGIRAE